MIKPVDGKWYIVLNENVSRYCALRMYDEPMNRFIGFGIDGFWHEQNVTIVGTAELSVHMLEDD